ncbi:MAG: polysaccharide deacetylase family protein [Deltaproteobacteria bacterium]|nr:polysaccharide deacetylase family protein [Deltaproteobacteria bacterium]
MSRLALTLDLDGPSEYAAIYALDARGADPLVMYGEPLTRFAELCQELGGAGTVFAIGRDVRDQAAAALRALAQQGFEIACHSFAHDYRLSAWPAAQIHEDLTRARDIMAHELGAPPVGFRAPGYNLSPALLDQLERTAFAYDSSALPSPPYYVAKAVVLAAYRILGRRSAAFLGSPGLLLAPRRLYTPGAHPYRRGARSLVELPISVGLMGLALVGDVLWALPTWLRRALARSFAADRDVVVSLHAIDFADAQTLPGELARHHRAQRLSWPQRREILHDLLPLLAASRRLVTCGALAAVL